MRYIEYQIVIGDSPPGVMLNDLRNLAHVEYYVSDEIPTEKDIEQNQKALFPKGIIHHLPQESYVWNFSLVYREENFDIIKWKTSFAWKTIDKTGDYNQIEANKALFIGATAGIFFIMIDEEIYENFNKLADMMDIFIEKTDENAPFIVYGLIENKQKVAELKENEELLKNVADVKKWVTTHKGEFRMEILKEIKSNPISLINDYSHFILTARKSYYPKLKLGEVHYLDYDDLIAWKGIENSLVEHTDKNQTIDQLIFNYLKNIDFQEEKIETITAVKLQDDKQPLKDVIEPRPLKMKKIIKEIQKTIRRTCPNCGNNNRKMIREVIDRENIIMENPNVYGLKFTCGKCGFEWK
ncbi:MAG: hypothetical protein ACFFHV_12930 [Promethearchaeota archaeon]